MLGPIARDALMAAGAVGLIFLAAWSAHFLAS